jgi:hypothetical protein
MATALHAHEKSRPSAPSTTADISLQELSRIPEPPLRPELGVAAWVAVIASAVVKGWRTRVLDTSGEPPAILAPSWFESFVREGSQMGAQRSQAEVQAPTVEDEFRKAVQKDGLPSALRLLSNRAKRRSIPTRDAALLAVEHALRARSVEVDDVRSEVLNVAPIEELLGAALRRFSSTGTEDSVTFAASLVSTDRTASWPILADLVDRRDPACEWFVEEVLATAHEAPEHRSPALTGLAVHPDVNVRRRLLEAASDYPLAELREVLMLLAKDSDDEIRERALSLLGATK